MSIFNTKDKYELDTGKLHFSYFDQSTDDFSNLDFTLKDGLDPLGVDKFIHDVPEKYVENHVSKVYSIHYEGKLVGFFTLSMAHIEIRDVNDADKLNQITFKSYPSLLLGQMGVEKNSRGWNIGIHIINFCIGLGQLLNEKIACAFLILKTSKSLAERYYEPDCDFIWKKSEKQIVWMYRKLF